MDTILTHVVLKLLREGGTKRLPGELVDARYWSLTEKLVEQRYIAPVPPGTVPVQTTDGRWWLDGSGPRRERLQIARPPRKVEVRSTAAGLRPPGVDEEPEEEPVEGEGQPESFAGAEDAASAADDAFPEATGGGWWRLSNGDKIQGKDAAAEAQRALEKEKTT